jgi:hypothetical protein
MKIRTIVLLCCTMALTACGGPYVVRGKVVSSPYQAIDFVDADDERLVPRGLAGAEVRIYRDPGKMNMAQAGRALAGPDGSFQITLSEFGAGWMDEVWRITAARSGFGSAEMILPLPNANAGRQLLIMMTPGYTPPSQDDEQLIDIYEKYR